MIGLKPEGWPYPIAAIPLADLTPDRLLRRSFALGHGLLLASA